MKKLHILLAAMLTFSSTTFAQIGSLSSDLVFTPVTPCRLFDTRPSQGGTGAIPAAGTKGFAVWGQTSFAAQGGAANNCGVVAAANTAAIAVNLTVVLPNTAGFITAYPTGAPLPLAATVNFNPGDIRGNFAIVNVQQTGAAPSLNVYSTSTVDVVGDVVGYYSKPVATALECVNTAYTSAAITTATLSGHFIASVFAPACSNGYTSTALHCTTDNATASANPKGTDGIECTAYSRQLSGSVYARQRCCRTPGR